MSRFGPPPVAALVPHAGPMCLLDRVIDWDAAGIRCEATVGEAHPLQVDGRLPATSLIEYAAQAMAAHGRLIAGSPAGDPAGDPATDEAGDGTGPRPGRLVGLRATELACRWVTERRLRIEVRRLGGDPANVLYGFEVFGEAPRGEHPLASGRAVVTLVAGS